MQCVECGAECKPGEDECLACKAKLSQVRVLSEEEKTHFDGMTLEQDNDQNSNQYRSSNTGDQRTYVRQFQFSSSNAGFFTKLFLGAGLVALIMLFALPLLLVFSAIAFFGWFFIRRLK